jgi:thioredoxin 1
MVNLVTSAADFSKAIEKGVSVVDFYATWCGPCKVLIPPIHTVAVSIPLVFELG